MAQAEVKVVASLDNSQFKAGLSGMSSQLAGLKGMIAGAFSVGAVVSFAKKMLDTGDALDQAAKTFGISITSMIAFKSAMAESGIGADQFLRIFGKLNSTIVDAKKGTATATDAFKDMNISQRELAGLSIDKVLELMAKKYGEAGDKAAFLNGVSGAFGERIGPKLIDVFQRINSEGMDKFAEGAQKAAEGMLALAKMSDFIDAFKDKLVNFSASGVGALQDLADIADATMLTLQGVISPKDIFKVAHALNAAIKAKEAAKNAKGDTDESSLASTPAENKWYALLEEKTLARMNLTQKIAYYEQEISALQKSRAENPTDLTIASDILEREKKINALKNEAAKQSDKVYDDYAKQTENIKAQDKIIADFKAKRAGILSGEGADVPVRARVDSLQAVGGIIGGVSGRGDQAARIAERQAKTQEAIAGLMRDTNSKLDDLNRKIDGIISE